MGAPQRQKKKGRATIAEISILISITEIEQPVFVSCSQWHIFLMELSHVVMCEH